jgi:tetratricopeptide (TPR) repeat protein
VYEVTHALNSIRVSGVLAPGEIRLLSYLVEETLAGRASNLHQKIIAADVFGKEITSFNPRSDSIVRTTAGNLRAALASYYASRGQADRVRIELHPGTYVPEFCSLGVLSPQAGSQLWSARASMEARTVSGYRAAIGKLDEVLAEDPNCSVALALKAEALASQAIHGVRPRPNLEEARVFAHRAVEQAHPAWQAWLALGIVKQALDRDWDAVEDCYGRAVELSGGQAEMNVWYTAFLAGRGRAREAARNLQRAVDHTGYNNHTCMGDLSLMLILARDYRAAGTVVETGLQCSPGYYQHHLHRAILLEALGDASGALRALDQTPLRLLERPVTWGLRGLFAGLSGSPEVAMRRIQWLRAAGKTGKHIPQSQIAACWIGAGNCEEAAMCLERAAEERDPLTVLFRAYPMTRHLKGNARYDSLMTRLGLIEN